VKRFADNFGGTVMCQSEPGRGATFCLRLPLVGAVKAQEIDRVAAQSPESPVTGIVDNHN
jgi:chemotaxis protein histidine kinase CheA